MCRRRGLKVNAGKSKVILLGGEEGLECEVCIDGIRLELVSEFKYLGYVLDESGTDEAGCGRRRVAGAEISLVNARSLQLECGRVLHESLLVLILTYGRETMTLREKEGSRIRAVQMDNFRDLLGMRRMDKIPNARIRQLGGVTKGVDEKIDEDVLRWFGHVERMENARIAMRVYVGECAGIRSVGRQRKRWIDAVKDCL